MSNEFGLPFSFQLPLHLILIEALKMPRREPLHSTQCSQNGLCLDFQTKQCETWKVNVNGRKEEKKKIHRTPNQTQNRSKPQLAFIESMTSMKRVHDLINSIFISFNVTCYAMVVEFSYEPRSKKRGKIKIHVFFCVKSWFQLK